MAPQFANSTEAWRQQILGELVPHVTHRMGNLMAVVNGSAELLAMDEVDRERLETLELVTANSKRAIALMRGLGAHARSKPGPPEILDLNAVLGGLSALFAPLVKAAGFELELDEPSGVTIIQADRASLELLLLGLLVGAMSPGEELVPRAGNLRLRVVELASRVVVTGRWTVQSGLPLPDFHGGDQAAAVLEELGASLRLRQHGRGLSMLIGLAGLA